VEEKRQFVRASTNAYHHGRKHTSRRMYVLGKGARAAVAVGPLAVDKICRSFPSKIAALVAHMVRWENDAPPSLDEDEEEDRERKDLTMHCSFFATAPTAIEARRFWPCNKVGGDSSFSGS
jgi:hypothetical protein